MASTPPGWLPDPYGRAEQRQWDGSQFTARIRNEGEESQDPLGATVTIPFTNPTGITPTPRVVGVEPRSPLAAAKAALSSLGRTIRRLFQRS